MINRRESSRRQLHALLRGRKSKRSLMLAETILYKRLIKLEYSLDKIRKSMIKS